jgi:hypothetical protein
MVLGRENRMRLALCVVLLSLAVLACGCGETRLTGFTDPAFKGPPYSNLVVMARSGDLIHDQTTEMYFVQCLSKRKVRIRPSTDFFPPTRDVTDEEIGQRLTAEGVQAVIAVHLDAQWTATGFSKGTSYAIPCANHTLRLIDVRGDPKRESVVWKASASSSAEMSTDREMLFSLASKTTATLLAEGLICPAKTTAGR